MSTTTIKLIDKSIKPNCHECVHRGGVPGSSHSSCHHPAFNMVKDNPILNLMSIFASVGRSPPIQIESKKCIVIGDPHGIAKGWFNHPFDFDPVWLQSCTGFTKK